MPYLPVYYHSLGHGGLMIGMLGAVKPLTTFIVAPVWGILSDRSSSRFFILYMTFLSSMVFQLLVSASPEIHFLIGMVFCTAVMNAPVKSLIDAIVLDNLQDKSSYGRMRLWGQLGFGIGSWGVGQLLSLSNVGAKINELQLPDVPLVVARIAQSAYAFWMSLTGYRLLFLSYAALSVPTFIILRQFEVMDRESIEKESRSNLAPPKKEPAKIKEGLALLLKNADALLFFFLVFVVGVSSGVIENFAYVRLREVGGTGKEMGLSRLVSSAAGAPMFWFSGPLTNLLGADRVIVISLLNYVARFFIYAFMKNPYHGLPAEALRGVTFAAFWSTCTIYAHRISPPGMGATMLLLLNAMYGGLGQSVGAILGGRLQSKVGTVQTFIYAGLFDLVFVAVVLVYLRMRPESSFKDPKPLGTETKKVR
jgi:MFS transporter, PPP family, 3-phenylpropionic acid transporter